MKRIGTLIAAAAAAMTMAATFAVASASAGTVLCNEAKAACSAPAKIAPAGALLKTGQSAGNTGNGFMLSEGSVKLLQCGTSSLDVQTKQENASPLTGTTGISLSSCQYLEGWSCDSASTNTPNATVSANSTGGVIRIGSVNEPLTVTFLCNTPFAPATKGSCSYSSNGQVNIVYNRAAATYTVSGASMVRTFQSGSMYCPAGMKLSLNHKVQGEWLISRDPAETKSSGETVLCAKLESPCANVLGPGNYLVTGGSNAGKALTIFTSAGSLTCDYSVIEYKTLAEGGAPNIPVSVYSNLPPLACAGLGSATKNCTSTSLNVPSAELIASGAGTGVAKLGTLSQPLTVSFTCGGAPPCTYAATGVVNLPIPSATTWNARLQRTSGTCPDVGWLSMEGTVGGTGVLSQF